MVDNFNDEIAELKANSTRIWFNFDTSSPGVIFVKLHDCMKELVDVHKLSEHMFTSPESHL
jgi:hypothetical protein